MLHGTRYDQEEMKRDTTPIRFSFINEFNLIF